MPLADQIREAPKKLFFSGPITIALTPPPPPTLKLSGHRKLFSLVVRPLPPPPTPSGQTSKKKNFFGFLMSV